ncbi:MAG: glycosyl transferase [Acidobacteria bacterium]|nr:MAG: glycosyl transferase [Acidobacteriota bacterium]
MKYFRGKLRGRIAKCISAITRYSDACYQICTRPEDEGELLNRIECSKKQKLDTLPQLEKSKERILLLLNGVFNFHLDIEGLLRELRPGLSRHVRLVVVAYNPYLRFLFSWAGALRLRSGEVPQTFLTRTDLNNVSRLAGFEVVRLKPTGSLLCMIPLVGNFLDALIGCIPLLKQFSLTYVIVLRPVIVDSEKPSLSIVIPARNEKGNIEDAVKRLKSAGVPCTEIVFVEGHSTDGTYEEIERVMQSYSQIYPMKALKQSGKGKSDAVRLGFQHCTGELLTVLDADLTMPPELLMRFYEAYSAGLADFINGSRLLYPMEDQAMRYLNRLGNVFFAKMLSTVLDAPIGDSLCGTKLFSRRDYERFCSWRADFGEFDPYGDFELIFPAAILALGIVDVPIRYRARTYGSTNIRRFADGFQLLKMTLIGFFKVKLT